MVRRRGFTIIELIVSIGLLALMMSLAGKVFSISVASTGQATALIEVSQSFRLLEVTLRDDLRSINPERSMLVIAANPINAYWTAEGRELDSPANSGDSNPANGYLHDGDPERQYTNGDMVPPRADVLMTFTSRKAHSVRYPSIWSNIVQVVYGHAELGELDSSANWTAGPIQFPTDGSPFLVPAETWHLARRNVVIVDAPEDTLDSSFTPSVNDVPDSPDEGANPSSFPLSNASIDLIAQPGLDTTPGRLFFHDEVAGPTPPPNATLQRWYRRSRMDLTPPAQLGHRVAHYFLPKCASFKVEWALGDSVLQGESEVVWVDSADVTGSVIAQLNRFIANETDPGRQAALASLRDDLFVAPGPFASSPHIFLANDSLWPTALRITVDVYDNAGRLSRPTRHVFILPIGEG